MTSRERVKCALNHEKPDRVPTDLGGGVSTLTYGAYARLIDYMGIKEPKGEIGEFKVMVGIDEDILEQLEVDFRHIFMKAPKGWEPKVFDDGTFEDEWGIRFRDVGYYTEMIGHPLQDASIDDLDSFHWPDFTDKSRVEGLREKAESLYNNTDYALAAGSVGGRIFEQAQWLRGMQQFLEDLIINQEFVETLMDKLVEIQKEFFDLYLDAIGEYIEVIVMGDDLGTQDNLLISPKTYRTLIKPRQAEVYSYVKDKTDAKIMHHTCGAAYPFIGDLIEIGVDILNPIQPLAKGMDREKIKRDFGDKLCFWGGIDEQKVLPFGGVQDVINEVKRAIKALNGNGGYILSAAHNIQPDVSPQNIIALFKAAVESEF